MDHFKTRVAQQESSELLKIKEELDVLMGDVTSWFKRFEKSHGVIIAPNAKHGDIASQREHRKP